MTTYPIDDIHLLAIVAATRLGWELDRRAVEEVAALLEEACPDLDDAVRAGVIEHRPNGWGLAEAYQLGELNARYLDGIDPDMSIAEWRRARVSYFIHERHLYLG